MVFRLREVALFLGDLGALGQLLGAFVGLGLGAVALRGLLPVVDLLLDRGLGGVVAGGAEAEPGLFGRGLHRGAADALGLEERPQVRGLDILGDGFGLRALAQRFRKRQAQRDDRDQQRDVAILVGGFLGLVRLLHALMCAHDILPA